MFYYKPRIKTFLINGPIFANADCPEEKENVLSMDSLWAGRRNQSTGLASTVMTWQEYYTSQEEK